MGFKIIALTVLFVLIVWLEIDALSEQVVGNPVVLWEYGGPVLQDLDLLKVLDM